MIALRVLHNGSEVCVAGVGDLGVINAHVVWVHSLTHRDEPDGPPKEHEELTLHIGGLHTPTDEHRDWNAPALTVGDKVTIDIIETEEISPHDHAKTFPWGEHEEPD